MKAEKNQALLLIEVRSALETFYYMILHNYGSCLLNLVQRLFLPITTYASPNRLRSSAGWFYLPINLCRLPLGSFLSRPLVN